MATDWGPPIWMVSAVLKLAELQAAGVPIVKVIVRLPVQPLTSVAVTVNVNMPAMVGVPEIVPIDEIVNPVGNAPLVVKVNGPVPSVADKFASTLLPTVKLVS